MNTNRMMSTTKHHPNTFWGSAAAALAAFALAATPATAEQVQTPVSSADDQAYAADVSNTDLLTGKTATLTGNWNLDGSHGGATPAALNDGVFSGTGAPVQGAWTTVGATAEYHLGLGANNLGYDLTSIQSIADWPGAGFGNQAFTVKVKLKDALDYTTLATVDYEPFTPDGGNATKVTLTDTTGVLISGVEFIKFTANSVNSVDHGFIWREIDVFGVSTGGDTTPPTIVTVNPTDNATGVANITGLVATFTENILRGTGKITIKNLDTSALTEIPVGDSQVSVAGPVLTIHPTVGLAALTNYAIRIDAGAITDLANNPFAGIADDTTWNFTTMAQVQTRVFSITELAYAGDVSNSDLLTGLTATTTGWKTGAGSGGATPLALNDGFHGLSYWNDGCLLYTSPSPRD